MEKGMFYMETRHLCVYMARLLAKGRVRNLPPGSANNGVYWLIAMSDHESLPSPPYHNVPSGKLLTGKSCHSNTEKCTRMTKCRQDASRYW